MCLLFYKKKPRLFLPNPITALSQLYKLIFSLVSEIVLLILLWFLFFHSTVSPGCPPMPEYQVNRFFSITLWSPVDGASTSSLGQRGVSINIKHTFPQRVEHIKSFLP